jgi:hypothetical protein
MGLKNKTPPNEGKAAASPLMWTPAPWPFAATGKQANPSIEMKDAALAYPKDRDDLISYLGTIHA